MRRTITVTTLLTAFASLSACKARDDAARAAAAPGEPDRAHRDVAPALAPTPAAAPARDPAPPTDAARPDCAALFTAADLHELCGFEAEIRVDGTEGAYDASACLRDAHPPGVRRRRVQFSVLQTGKPDGGRVLFELGLTTGEERGRLMRRLPGDAPAVFSTGPGLVTGSRQSFEAAHGSALIHVSADTDPGETPLCSDDALIAVGQRVLSRLAGT